jgi:O-antigen ligase
LLRDAQTRNRLLMAATVLGLLGYYVLFPALDSFTDGALSSRFADTGLTNRDTIVEADLAIFRDHPFLGVGPGLGNYHREAYLRNTPAHTEYTRMLAEHGVFGIASLVAIAFLIVNTLRQRRTYRESAAMMALFVWSALFLLSYGMRLAAPSFMIGLACCLPAGAAVPYARGARPLRRGVVAPAR